MHGRTLHSDVAGSKCLCTMRRLQRLRERLGLRIRRRSRRFRCWLWTHSQLSDPNGDASANGLGNPHGSDHDLSMPDANSYAVGDSPSRQGTNPSANLHGLCSRDTHSYRDVSSSSSCSVHRRGKLHGPSSCHDPGRTVVPSLGSLH